MERKACVLVYLLTKKPKTDKMNGMKAEKNFSFQKNSVPKKWGECMENSFQEQSLGILVYIEKNYQSLTSSLQKIALFILSSPGKIISITTSDLAHELDVSEATVVRFCQALGFKGFTDFKIKLAKDLGADNHDPVPGGFLRQDSSYDVIQKVMQAEYDDIRFTLEMLDMDAMLHCLNLLCLCNKIAFFGVGSSGIVAADAKEHFLHYGKNVSAERDSISQIILANSLGKDDLAFAISISGQSSVPLQAIKIAKENGAHTVCLTQNPKSTIAYACECVLVAYRRSNYADDLGTMSRIVHSAIIDSLAVAYAAQNWEYAKKITTENRKNYRSNQFSK